MVKSITYHIVFHHSDGVSTLTNFGCVKKNGKFSKKSIFLLCIIFMRSTAVLFSFSSIVFIFWSFTTTLLKYSSSFSNAGSFGTDLFLPAPEDFRAPLLPEFRFLLPLARSVLFFSATFWLYLKLLLFFNKNPKVRPYNE